MGFENKFAGAVTGSVTATGRWRDEKPAPLDQKAVESLS
jgi:hypothetical protein